MLCQRLKLLIFSCFLSALSACALNNSEGINGPLGPIKGGETSEDPDYYINLWPDRTNPKQDENPYKQVNLKNWPDIKPKTNLFIGDESLHYNWGLVLKSSFSDKDQESLFLSGCDTSALDWKNGGSSDCGLVVAPYTKFSDQKFNFTVDTKQGSERALPVILSQENIQKVIISFGYHLKDINNEKKLREELTALEVLAKWTHSTGKVCHFVSPVGPYFFEAGNANFLPETLLKKIKEIVSPYCYWVDASEVRNNFIKATGMTPETTISHQTKNDSQAEIIRVKDSPNGVENVVESIEDWNLPKSDIDMNLPEVLSDEPELQEEETQKNEEQKETQTDKAQLGTRRPLPRPEGLGSKEEDKETILIDGEQVELKDVDIPRPEPRPTYVNTQESANLKEEIELKAEQSGKAIRQAEAQSLSYQEPKYLWNGYARGSEFTQIGKEELKRWGERLYETQQLSDATNYCPNYWNLSQADRKNVWLFLYSAMALYESTFNPNAGGKEVSGGTSIGLFQLHYDGCRESAGNGGAEALKNPRINFRCAIRKSSYFVRKGQQIASGYFKTSCKRQGCKYFGGSLDRYWSTLRNPYMAKVIHKGRTVDVKVGKRPKVINHLRSLPHCQK